MGIDVVLSTLVTVFAYWLIRFVREEPVVWSLAIYLALLAATISALAFAILHVHRVVMRFTTLRETWRMGMAMTLKVIILYPLIHVFYPQVSNDIFHMADLGFTELSMEPVVCDPSDPSALTEADLPILKEQYEILAKEMIKRDREGRGFTFYHYMIDLTGGPCIYKRISGCGSGTEYMAVTPWGDLYPCHQFVGDPKYLLGDIWKGVTNTAVRDEFKHCNAYARKECQDCWAKLYCSGGCAANSYHATGSITGVYEYGCELFKKRMECAIMIKVAENQELAAKGIEVPIELGSTCNACADGEACE